MCFCVIFRTYIRIYIWKTSRFMAAHLLLHVWYISMFTYSLHLLNSFDSVVCFCFLLGRTTAWLCPTLAVSAGRQNTGEHWRPLDFVLWRFMILISKVARRFRNNCVGPCGNWVFFHFDVFSNHNIGSSNPSQLLCFSQVCRLRYFDFLDSFCRRYHVSISRCLGRGVHQKPTELWSLRGAETEGGVDD